MNSIKIEVIACPLCGTIVRNTVVDLSIGDDHSHASCPVCGWDAVDETFPVLMSFTMGDCPVLNKIMVGQAAEHSLNDYELSTLHSNFLHELIENRYNKALEAFLDKNLCMSAEDYDALNKEVS